MLAQHSRFADQAAALRARSSVSTSPGRSIAVISGKGGVGKTSMAVNLAVALGMRGLRATLLDLDLGLANVDLLLDLHPSRTLAHVMAGSHTLDDIVINGPAGVRVIPGASGLERLANFSELQRQQLLHYLALLEASSDFMILDLGAGVSRNVLGFAAAADIVLVITTPEPTALADAYSAVKLLVAENRSTDFDVLVNQVRHRGEGRATYERIAGVAGRFLGVALTSAGYMPSDPAVVAAVRARKPFILAHPRSAAAACMHAVAQRYIRAAAQARALSPSGLAPGLLSIDGADAAGTRSHAGATQPDRPGQSGLMATEPLSAAAATQPGASGQRGAIPPGPFTRSGSGAVQRDHQRIAAAHEVRAAADAALGGYPAVPPTRRGDGFFARLSRFFAHSHAEQR